MKRVIIWVFGLAITLGAASAFAQELTGELENTPHDGSMTGALNHIAGEQSQIVVDDYIFALGETVWVDGVNYPADQLDEVLSPDQKLTLELSDQQRHGHRLVTRIRTNP